MGNKLGSEARPLRAAIVGSGPSGFYAASALLNADAHVEVDMFERLPSPFGLVRLGVAPDHAKIKNVIKIYERTAAKEGFRYFGNVEIGRDLTVEELRKFYDVSIFANGAQSDRNLNIPGEALQGSWAATEFVAWYNGHPDYRDLEFDFSHETAVVIGQGNVAADVCRILLKPVDELKHTDIAAHALEQLAKSSIKTVYMVGRRGPVQAKFTQLEIKELGEIAGCTAVINEEVFNFDPASQAEFDDPASKTAAKNIPIMKAIAEAHRKESDRILRIEFCKSPLQIKGETHVESIVLEHNELIGEPFKVKSKGTGVSEEIPCGLVLRSVGYRGTAMPGVPFDDSWGVYPHENGRIVGEEGMYVVGWIKRGPSGVIGTNKPCSQETVAQLLEDIPNLTPCAEPDKNAVINELNQRNVRLVSYEDWKKIDVAEVARGEASGKPREKFSRVSEMLKLLEK